jgi:DNA-directed RNA polymerase I subunit RPA43
MANQMLSVVGSIQPDPFSPHHVPAQTTSSPTQSQEDDEAEVLSELVIDHSNSSEDEEDAFAKLGKMADKAKETEMRIRKENEASVEKETSKKKKRKAGAEGSTHERKAGKKLKRKKP